jgi:putative PIG3 family NAD(P)H quinone oxidoreductase
VRAVTVPEPGGPDALVWAEVEDPRAGAGEVVLDVVAAGVNRADLLQRQGFYPPPVGAPAWPGLECSGRVSALGSGVTGWAVGDEVCALLSGGGYAEQVAVPAGQLMPVPAGVDLLAAAGLPEAAATVWSNLVLTARLGAGEWLLVHGGSSGIGTMAVQVAVALGAHVACTVGTAPGRDLCRELGAEVTIDYRGEDFVAVLREATDGRGADVVLDNMGAAYLPRNLDALATGGRLVTIGMQGGTRGELDLGALLRKQGSVHASSLRARPAGQKAQIVAAVQADLWPLVARGAVRPVVHAVLPMPQAAGAHRLLETGGHLGKVLLAVPGSSAAPAGGQD